MLGRLKSSYPGSIAFLVGCSFLLMGCATRVENVSEAAAVVIPVRWGEDVVSTPGMNSWLSEMGDAALVDLVNEGLAHNQNLQVAAGNLRVAKGLARAQWGVQLPQLSASGGVALDGPIEGSGDAEGYTTGLNLSWELDLWGRLADAKSAATSDLKAAQIDFDAARLSLSGAIAQLWYDLLTSEARLSLNEETVTSYQANERILERRYDAGLSGVLDLRLARTSARRAETERAASAQEVDQLKRALEVLVGRYPEGKLRSEASLPALSSLEGVPMPSELLQARPDLKAAQYRYESAVRSSGAARKLRYPKLSLNGTIGFASGELSGLFDRPAGIYSLVGGVSAPLFQGGKIQGQIEAASGVEDAALATFASRLLVAFQEVESGLANERLLEAQEARLQLVVAEATEAERLAWDQYQRGLVEMTTVLSAQRSALESRKGWIKLRNERIKNRIRLYLALGGDRVEN